MPRYKEQPAAVPRYQGNPGSPFSQSNATPPSNGTPGHATRFNYTQTEPLREPQTNMRTSAIETRKNEMNNVFNQAMNKSRGFTPGKSTGISDIHVMSPSYLKHRETVDSIKSSIGGSRFGQNGFNRQPMAPFENQFDRPTSSTRPNTYGQMLQDRSPQDMIFHDHLRQSSAPIFTENYMQGLINQEQLGKTLYESHTINDPANFNMNKQRSANIHGLEAEYKVPSLHNDLEQEVRQRMAESRAKFGLPMDPREGRLLGVNDITKSQFDRDFISGRQIPEYNLLDQRLNGSNLNGYPQPQTNTRRSPSPRLQPNIITEPRLSDRGFENGRQNQAHPSNGQQQYQQHSHSTTQHHSHPTSSTQQTAHSATPQQRISNGYREARPAPLHVNNDENSVYKATVNTTNYANTANNVNSSREEVYASTPGLDKYRSSINLGLVGIPNIGHSCYM